MRELKRVPCKSKVSIQLYFFIIDHYEALNKLPVFYFNKLFFIAVFIEFI